MTSQSTASREAIPILFLKTRSQPDDTYEELFDSSRTQNRTVDAAATVSGLTEANDEYQFSPHFIPVLEHTQNESAMTQLGELLHTGDLKRKYGGMIFTSQRAVEAWADVVHKVEANPDASVGTRPQRDEYKSVDDAFADLESLTPFPLYVVGPATERALQTLATEVSTNSTRSIYRRLDTSIHGSSSGNGAKLADFMLAHYNRVHEDHWFTYYEAPRLPFIPLLGMSSQNYGRKRLEKDDPRLVKKPLLFLVGEVRRDIIPKTLMGQPELNRRIEVEEVEVYRTDVMKDFAADFARCRDSLDQEHGQREGLLRAVVVFSPQGSDVMLKAIGYLDEQGNPSKRAKRRWWQKQDVPDDRTRTRWIIVTIGPTTRDYLKDKLGVEPDVSASKPSPQGLNEAIEGFLREKNTKI